MDMLLTQGPAPGLDRPCNDIITWRTGTQQYFPHELTLWKKLWIHFIEHWKPAKGLLSLSEIESFLSRQTWRYPALVGFCWASCWIATDGSSVIKTKSSFCVIWFIIQVTSCFCFCFLLSVLSTLNVACPSFASNKDYFRFRQLYWRPVCYMSQAQINKHRSVKDSKIKRKEISNNNDNKIITESTVETSKIMRKAQSLKMSFKVTSIVI